MTYAESNYLGSAIATNNQASFTFTYLDVSEIRVDITVSGTTTTYTTSSNPAGFSIISPNQYVTLSSHPADSDTIRIYRVTNLDNTQATFVAGSAISANDLNNNYKQVLHASQETRLESASASTTATAASSAVSGATATANTALSTANTASTNATNALNAVNNVVAYTIVANVSSLPASPADGDRIEISDSTNAESTSSITGLPSNFTGSSGINIRLQYSSSSSSFVFVDYIVQDPDSRYGISNQNTRTTDSVTFAGITGPLTGDVTGNADTATALQTPINIAGQSFDGSANISIAATDLSDTNQSLSTTDDVTFDVVTATSYTETVATAQTALDSANGGIQTYVTASNTTFTDSMSDGESLTLMLRRGSTSHTITFPSIKWVGGIQPSITSTSASYSVIVLWKVGSQLYGSYSGDAY